MSEFIKITKDGEVIEVHPDALADHKRLGWVEVSDLATQEEAPAAEELEAALQLDDEVEEAVPAEKPMKKKK